MKEHYLIPDWPAAANIHACVTRRSGGCSTGPFASMNLALRSGDDPVSVLANRERIKSDWSLSMEPQWLKQVHGTDVVFAQGDGKEREGDAVWTDQQGLACTVLTADCLPVIFCNRSGSKVAAAHAGWKGLQAGVLEETVRVMSELPENILAWMGPAISQAHFEVGPEVRQTFVDFDPEALGAFIKGEGDRWFGDLYTLARQRLTSIGVQDVYGGGFCTYQDSESWFSYRRDGSESGRLATMIWMS